MIWLIQTLTYFRIISGPIIFFLILFLNSYFLSLFLFLLACISDYLDGYLARRYNLTSIVGEIMDPIADKILIVFLIMALALHLNSPFIGFAGGIMLAREFWVSALRDLNARMGDTQATAVTFIAKIKTSIQMFAFLGYLLGISTNIVLIIFISHFIYFLAFLITLYTGLEYTKASFRGRDFFKYSEGFLKKE